MSEDIDTLFDVTVLGRRIGAFRATLSNGQLTFANPAEIATALDGTIAPDAVIRTLSQPLDLNEQYRCFPGQTVGCGLLPPGVTGAIVDPQRFSVELFFSADDATIEQRPPLILGPSSSIGPTLIQNVGVSFATNDFFGGEVEYGGFLDTYASIGQTALIAQTLLSSGSGNRLNQLRLQRIFSERIAQGGLLENFRTSLLTNYRMVGGEFGTFLSPLLVDDQLSASPLDVVLPRDADVEIRRNGVLLSVRRYNAGPQRLDTAGLPDGSYPVSIIARADGVVVVDEVRTFSKAGGLPPPGRTLFTFGAGVFVPEGRFGDPDEDEPFLPELQTDTPIVSLNISRRIASTTGAELNLVAVGDDAFAEGSVRTILSGLDGLVAVAAGTDGSYGASITGSTTVNDIRFTVSARTTRTDAPAFGGPITLDERYRPFVRSEDAVTAGAQMSIAGGSLGLSGSYSRADGFVDRYSAALRYSRPIEVAGRRGFLTAYAQNTDQDTRVGFTLNFGFGLGQNTSGSFSGGLEHVQSDIGSSRQGLSPILSASLSRRDRWRDFDVTSLANASTNADNDRVSLSAVVLSPYGSGDITAQHVRTQTGDFSSVFGNIQSGFVIGGGAYKIGIARPGEAVVLADLSTAGGADGNDPSSGYRIRVDSQPTGFVRAGQRTAVGLPAYGSYQIELAPENAPSYELDNRSQTVTLYPGNVVRLQFDASRQYTLFGQLVDAGGQSLVQATVRVGDDTTQTDQFGYFVLTGEITERLDIRTEDGGSCAPIPVANLIDPSIDSPFFRLGKVACNAVAQ